MPYKFDPSTGYVSPIDSFDINHIFVNENFELLFDEDGNLLAEE